MKDRSDVVKSIDVVNLRLYFSNASVPDEVSKMDQNLFWPVWCIEQVGSSFLPDLPLDFSPDIIARYAPHGLISDRL
ncbi:hypothetical protein Q1695_012367 [Nippostrongylus brasiliensis]|nr:hypothetical protein Q1695_012367 [Nippostrongylus brasiliensis]